MKKLMFTVTVLTAMFLMIACGGSDSKNNDNKNQNQSSGVCTYGTYECHGEDSYFCGYPDSSNEVMWIFAEKCNDGCNEQTGKCVENSNSENGDYEDPSDSDSESEEPTCEVDDNLTWSSKSESMMTWEQAISYCENLSEEGVSDWRLPTVCELRSLIQNCPATEIDGSCTFTDNCLNVTECINTDCIGCSGEEVYSKFGDLYGFWSSSEAEFSAGSTKMAFSVNFSYGSVDQNVTSLTNYVRCVRNVE
ncbi:DUF1566 domain-containing protein [bacterium]|nr:DUF1566 domain-containing protein [bacterium]